MLLLIAEIVYPFIFEVCDTVKSFISWAGNFVV